MREPSKYGKELREVFTETIGELMKSNKDIVYLDADLVGALGTSSLFSSFPNQSFDVGIMEANMVGVASGMSIKGKIPFVHSFGTFATRRCADQTFVSACYGNANIKIMGSDPGVTAELNGGTHMPFEDIGVYRSYPNITILDVSEPNLLKRMIKKIANEYGVYYMRFPRKGMDCYYDEEQTFDIGKGIIVQEGVDATVIASGIEVPLALQAAKKLENENIKVRVVDMFTIKPLDSELVLACAEETGAIVTAENHNIIGGLGSAVAEVVAENSDIPLKRIGIQDVFGEVGDREFLLDKFKISEKHIVKAIKEVIKKKN